MEVEAARAWGVPHSILTGRIRRPGDAEWTAQDAAYAVALTALESMRCGGCGTDRRESMDPANEFAYHAEAMRCFACAARDREGEKYRDGKGSVAGLMFSVSKKEGPS